MAMKKLYLEQQKSEVLRPLSLEPTPEKDHIMGAFTSSIQGSLKRLSQQSVPKAPEPVTHNTTYHDNRSANNSTQQQNNTKDANNTSVDLQKTAGENGSQEIDRASNDGAYLGKKKAIVHNCVLQIHYRDEMFSPNSEAWMHRDTAKQGLIEGCRVSYFYTLS